MTPITTKPIDVNRFWEKTPTFLKYLVTISIIIVASYILASKKIDNYKVQNINKVDDSIKLTYEIIRKFELYEMTQVEYHKKMAENISNLHCLIKELNTSVDKRIAYILKDSKLQNKNLEEKIKILNNSFEDLLKAYEPILSSYNENSNENLTNKNNNKLNE